MNLLLALFQLEMHTNDWVISRPGRKQSLLQDINVWKLSFVVHVIGSKDFRYNFISRLGFGKPKMWKTQSEIGRQYLKHIGNHYCQES